MLLSHNEDPSQPSNPTLNPLNEPRRQKTLRLLSYLSQLLTSLTILLYCALSHSLFSSLNLFLLLLLTITTIVSPRRLSYSSLTPFVTTSPFSSRLLWTIVLAINLFALLFKAFAYPLNLSAELSSSTQSFLELQSPLHAFLPTLLLPLTLLNILHKPNPESILNYTHPFNPRLTIPFYLLLSCFILLIQILSISLIGLFYFTSMIFLIFLGHFSFTNTIYKFILIFLQILCLIVIFLSYLVTCEILIHSDNSLFYSFYGIDSLNHFKDSHIAQGHFVC